MGAAALVPPGHTSMHPCTILGIGAFVLTRSHHPLCSATSYRNGRGILAVCTPSTPQCFPCSPSKETRGKPVRGLRLAARRNKWPKHSSVTGILPFHPPSADRSRPWHDRSAGENKHKDSARSLFVIEASGGDAQDLPQAADGFVFLVGDPFGSRLQFGRDLGHRPTVARQFQNAPLTRGETPQ